MPLGAGVTPVCISESCAVRPAGAKTRAKEDQRAAAAGVAARVPGGPVTPHNKGQEDAEEAGAAGR